MYLNLSNVEKFQMLRRFKLYVKLTALNLFIVVDKFFKIGMPQRYGNVS